MAKGKMKKTLPKMEGKVKIVKDILQNEQETNNHHK